MTNSPTNPIYSYEFTVPTDALDENGHVNNVRYVQWMQEAAVRHYGSIGGIPLTQAIGATWVVRSHNIEYLRPAFAGDRIERGLWSPGLFRVPGSNPGLDALFQFGNHAVREFLHGIAVQGNVHLSRPPRLIGMPRRGGIVKTPTRSAGGFASARFSSIGHGCLLWLSDPHGGGERRHACRPQPSAAVIELFGGTLTEGQGGAKKRH